MKTNIQIGKEEVFKKINELYQQYSLPRLNISQEEWEVFFEITSKYFEQDNQLNDYIIGLNIVVIRAMNYALLDDQKEFVMEHLIRSLTDLSVCHIYLDQVRKMQGEIRERINQDKQNNANKHYVKTPNETTT